MLFSWGNYLPQLLLFNNNKYIAGEIKLGKLSPTFYFKYIIFHLIVKKIIHLTVKNLAFYKTSK